MLKIDFSLIQNKLFEALEEGKISNQNFINEIKKITDSASENQIIEAGI